MKEKNVVAIAEALPQNDEEKQKTTKKYLRKAEKITRRLDNVLNDLTEVVVSADDLTCAETTEVSEKDLQRFYEIREVTQSATQILYHLTERMARKYVGKNIEPLGAVKRKALKL